MSFIESDLHFSFSDAWWIIAWDKHTYFQGLSGAGLSGVDFIGLYEDQLVLLEVKNYRSRMGRADDPGAFLLEHTDIWAERMARKFRDTLRSIEAIEAYLQRSWRYRYFYHLFSSKKQVGATWHFWTKATEERLVVPALWLELDEAYTPILPQIETALQAALSDHAPFPLIGSIQNPLWKESLQVRLA